ncbi:GAF domain-containing protein [Erythrobacter arachoides]|uniref:histidine kinase n=1 Tax=Aurantiacibacter arachoides TaxID=1850444 RepID=A0A845A3C2_9SPHN|nr:HWE histidine kinase domain-containing protein [Aurantiacibacter arachoides]MXO94204.1 GAF domain-containing protein [Aurantiacibacter arachoides]GGD65274.1 signal transduction histidine kinase [Aurantiacibacter arachoides]
MSGTMPQVDLSSCDREPIHQLGHIQRFGALIAVTADWIVAFRSLNLGEIVDPRHEIAIGDRLAEHFSHAAMQAIRSRAADAHELGIVERLFGVDLLQNGRLFDVAVHLSQSFVIIEIEPGSNDGTAELSSSLRPLMSKLQKSTSIDDLCLSAATELKRFLGFDRVMVYRFHPDQSGEVVAEAREPHLEPFEGLRYPKTDIPAQARALYLRNLFRIIADVDEEPVPIEPVTSLGGEPLDLSMSTLRAVSPIHIEYLHNMGVGASLSISIVIDGKLWGLFACHHYAPLQLSYPKRTMAELFSQLFSLQLQLAIETAGGIVKDKARALHEQLMSQMVGGEPLSDNLKSIGQAIGRIIPHDGMSAYIDGAYTSHGIAPNEEEFLAIVPSLNTSSTGHIVHSDSLKGIIPAAGAFSARAAGALIIPVSRRPRDYVALWRKELNKVVTWAGNPEKVADVGPNGDRLTPRKSFAAWQQSVDGRSAPWEPEEISIAENLRVTLLEVILRITDEQVQERAKAQERQELLIAELNHRVRNILTLIRSVIGQSRSEATDVEGFAQIIGGRIQALAMAHDQITRHQWSPASLKELIRAEAEAYLAGKADRVIVTGPDAQVAPAAYTVLALVVHEMMTNSAKYGSLCDSTGQLFIELSFNRHTDLEINWRERGGPAVKAPQRRGFGSTIIERSIPFELKGDAEVRYNLGGVEADFLIPSKYATPSEAGDDAGADTAAPAPAAPQISNADSRDGVLVVEDSMIIAMDAEDMLRSLGFRTVIVASSAATALQELARHEPLFAILDYNLGDETSEAVAERLTALGVPFWFVTGYGDAVAQLSSSDARGVIQKPYSKSDLEGIVTSLSR